MNKANTIITLDGPAGVGKTTVAAKLADELDLPRLDSGAMFRFMALKLGKQSLTMPPDALLTQDDEWNFTLQGTGNNTVLLCNGKTLPPEIRSEATGLLASQLATRQDVREILRKAQQSLGKNTSLVAEGRDMGTVVFPDANWKFFLEASPEVRAQRRHAELIKKGETVSLASIEHTIRQRDAQDRERALSPLRPAHDAIIIDTSNLDQNQVLAAILSHIRSS